MKNFEVIDNFEILITVISVIFILYTVFKLQILPKLKGEKTFTQIIADATLDDDSEIISERDASLKEIYYFEKPKGGMFVTLFFISFFIFIIFLDFFSFVFSLCFLILVTLALYFHLYKSLNQLENINRKVKVIRGSSRKIHIKWRRVDTDRLLTIGDYDYYVPGEISLPEHGSYVEIEVYNDMHLLRINDESILENENLEDLQNLKTHHKSIFVTFLITGIISYFVLYEDTFSNFSMKILTLDKKNMEYVNANSIRNKPPEIGQRIDISGYRACKTENCRLFLLLDKPLNYEIDKNLERKIEVEKAEKNRIREEKIHEKIKKIKDDYNKKLFSGKMPDIYKYNKDLRNAVRSVPYVEINLLDVEKSRLEYIINNRFSSEKNQVVIRYLNGAYSYENDSSLGMRSYKKLLEQINNLTRVYGLKLMVYDYSKKNINGKDVTFITVIDNLSDEEIFDYQLVFFYIVGCFILALLHLYLATRKQLSQREKELQKKFITYE